MSDLPQRDHNVGRIRLDLDAGSFDAAMQLRTRAEELAWQRLPALLDTLFEALCPAGVEVRIERIELDLGEMAAHALEQDFPQRLEHALRAELAQAIGTAMHAPGSQVRALSLPAALLDEFETYLAGGTLPLRGASLRYDPARTLLALCREQPAALLAMLRRRGHESSLIERLVLQSGAQGWPALLEALAPTDAALILAYLAGLRLLHPQAHSLRLAPPALERALSVLSLTYLLHDPGSQFNRRSYLAFLLKGVALAEGVSYESLLGLLHMAAAKARTSQPLSGSLLGTLDELLAQLAASAPAVPGPQQVRQQAQEQRAGSDALASAQAGDLAPLLRQLQAADPGGMAQLVDAMPVTVFAGLVRLLQPLHAALILDHVDHLTLLHRQRPRLHLSQAGFERQVRLMALRYLLLEAGSQFNRLSWLRRTMQALALAASVSYRFLLDSFGAALEELRARVPLSSSLPEGLAQLVDELGPPAGTEAVTPEAALALAERFLRSGQPQQGGAGLAALAAANPQGFSALLHRLLAAESGNAEALTQRLLDWMQPEDVVHSLLPGQAEAASRWAQALSDLPGADMASAWRQVLAAAWRGETLDAPGAAPWPVERLDRSAMLRHWLDHGVLPWWAAQGTRLDSLLASLRSWPLAELHALLDHGHGQEERIVWRLRRLYHQLEPDAALALLGRLAPWVLTPDGPLAALSPGRDAAALAELRIRATAAAMQAAPLDLARFARPIPAQSAPAAMAPPAPAMHGVADTQALLDWLAGAASAGAGAAAPPEPRALAGLLAQDSAPLRAALQAGLVQAAVRQRWIAGLPDEILARLLYRLAPALARFMLDLKTVLLTAWRQTAVPARHPGPQLWAVLLDLLAQGTAPTQQQITRQLLAQLAPPTPARDGRLLAQAQWLASQGGYANLGAALRAQSGSGKEAPPAPSPARAVAARPAAAAARSGAAQDGDIIYVANAGLVLLHPFLPRMFQQRRLLSDDANGKPRIAGADDASRAVHLLQWLVDARCDTPEPSLALNKLLCGLELDTPVAAAIVPDDDDLALCQQLLAAVTGNWSSIRNTSADGLRETFLRRDGRLQRRDGKWTLTVSRKTVDVLVDQIPWGFAVILHPWMSKELAVIW